jgi:hypothetical protein
MDRVIIFTVFHQQAVFLSNGGTSTGATDCMLACVCPIQQSSRPEVLRCFPQVCSVSLK